MPVRGHTEAAAAFRRLANQLAAPGNQAGKRSLEPTLAAAKDNLQQDGSIESGELLRAITIRRQKSSAIRPKYAVGADPKSKAGPRAHLLEFDTAPHKNAGARAGTDHPGTKGTRFMTRAFEATKQQVVELWAKEIGPAIERQAARLAARAAKKAGGK